MAEKDVPAPSMQLDVDDGGEFVMRFAGQSA
jgi:hypothetical protein